MVTKGIPFDVAFSLDADELLDWTIAIVELEGGKYDYQGRRFLTREEQNQ